MSRSFKCCRKDFSNYCCKICLNIFHPSCLDRIRNHVVVSGYRILCSKECQEIDNDNEAKEEKYNKLIETLKLDLTQKEVYIDRLRRTSRDLEVEAIESEREIAGQMKELNGTIDSLRGRLSELLEMNDVLKTELHRNEAFVRKIEEERDELREIQKQMLCSVETLGEDNEAYKREVMELKKQLCGGGKPSQTDATRVRGQTDEVENACILIGKDNNGADFVAREIEDCDLVCRSGSQPQKKLSCRPVINRSLEVNQPSRGGRVLILCDQYGSSLGRMVKLKLQSCSVQTIMKPNAGYNEVIEDIVNLSKDFTTDDHIFILAGSNDFRLGRYPSFKSINSKLKHCTHTNLHLVSVPFLERGCDLDKFIGKFNKKLDGYASKLSNCARGNVTFVDTKGIGRLSMFKKGVVEMIKSRVLSNTFINKTLTFIDPNIPFELPKNLHSPVMIADI